MVVCPGLGGAQKRQAWWDRGLQRACCRRPGTQSVEGGLGFLTGLGPQFSSRKYLPFSSMRPPFHICLLSPASVCVCVCVYLLMFGLCSAPRCLGFKKSADPS